MKKSLARAGSTTIGETDPRTLSERAQEVIMPSDLTNPSAEFSDEQYPFDRGKGGVTMPSVQSGTKMSRKKVS